MSRILGDPEKTAMTEFGHLVTGLSTAHCPTGAGRPKSLAVIRQELAKGTKQPPRNESLTRARGRYARARRQSRRFAERGANDGQRSNPAR